VRFARRWRAWLARAGVVCAPLQDGLARRYAGPPADTREEVLLWEGDKAISGGAEALVRCWARHPHGHAIAAWARLPGVPRILDLCYRVVAAHRPCGDGCRPTGKPEGAP